MGMNAKKIVHITDIKQQTNDFTRKIGGSMIGAIMGVNPYMSRMEAFAQLSGLMPGPEENQFMKMGNLLEPVVSQLYQEETGNKVRRVNFLLQHPDYEWATANIDREIYSLFIDEPGNGNGILEVKTASEYQDSAWRNGEIPPHYMCQLQWYLWITGYTWGAFAALVGGNKFYTYEVERNDSLIEAMKNEAHDFWNNHILTGIPPQPDTSESCKKALEAIYKAPTPKLDTELPAEAEDWIDAYHEACANIKFQTECKDLMANRLRAVMGDAEIGLIDGREAVTWKANKNGVRLLKVKEVQ